MIDQEERELLARITQQLDRCSAWEHRMARRRRVLGKAATALRLGKRASVVLAEIQAALPEAVITVQNAL